MKCLTLTLALLVTSPAAAGSSEGYGMGGQFKRFDPVVSQHNRSGELFRIRGHCQSACTEFLAIRNVCVERSAELLFHAGRDRSGAVSPEWTNHMLAAYKPRLRQYLIANHYVDSLEFHAISGAEIVDRFGYRECPSH